MSTSAEAAPESNGSLAVNAVDEPVLNDKEGIIQSGAAGAQFEPTEKETKEQEPIEDAPPDEVSEKTSGQSSKACQPAETNEPASVQTDQDEIPPEAPPTPITPDTPKQLASVVDNASEEPVNQSSPAVIPPSNSESPPSPIEKGNGATDIIQKEQEGEQRVDQGQDVSDLEVSSQQNSPERHGRRHDDDVDSSDDESSYFAKDMPSPKSRRFSFSSNASRGSVEVVRGEVDAASLSLSDDSEEGGGGGHHLQQAADTAGPYPASSRQAVGDLQVYDPGITRMHSASSLVSTNSAGSEELPEGYYRASSGLSPTKSGRRSPIMGEHAPSRGQGMYAFSSPSSFNPGPSPPTILPVHPPVGMPHPQPQMLSQDQWTAWMASGNAVYPYAMTAAGAPVGNPSAVESSTNSAWSASNEGSLGYSDDNVEGNQPTNSFASQKQKSQRREKQPTSNKGTRGGGEEGDSRPVVSARSNQPDPEESEEHQRFGKKGGFKVYWQRWIMLGYMSILNLLSDWTCYSVAPIALLTEEAFGHINPEQLVVVFLGANAVATACEPVILSRLGLRRTVVFGALLLMIGSIIKSGGMPPIIQAGLEKGHGEWRVYLGFFLVGLSQPLYQCTPALLSASWFPESERTMATGVALNANQLGIGFAFIFGTLLVSNSDDIPSYFGLLSIISTVAFMGALFHFDDAPPTPPSDTAKVMRGTLGTPNLRDMFESVRGLRSYRNIDPDPGDDQPSPASERASASTSQREAKRKSSKRGSTSSGTSRRQSGSRRSDHSSSKKGQETTVTSSSTKQSSSSGTRRRNPRSQPTPQSSGSDAGFHGLAPSPSPGLEPVSRDHPVDYNHAFHMPAHPAPSPMMPGGVGSNPTGTTQPGEEEEDTSPEGSSSYSDGPLPPQGNIPNPVGPYMTGPFPQMPYPSPEGMPPSPFSQMPYTPDGGMPMNAPYPGYPPYPYPYPYLDPRFQQFMQYQQLMYQPQQETQFYQPPADPYQYSYQNAPLPPQDYESSEDFLPSAGVIDRGAEPVVKVTPHHLDIEIADDQIIRSTRACLSRPGFIHSLVSFTVSGIVINTLSTFMDYLVRLNGAGREFTGIVGGSFQFVIMISSLIVGKICDKTRAYYSITVGMLVLGAFGLAECGVDLDADRGTELRWALIVVAALVGPLQPVSTELGVDVVYPLSENTVLVIQQLFSNLLSALFIPCFKAMKDVGSSEVKGDEERPEYTFSFYLLIVLHAAATVFFATFNGRYARYEHELEKKAKKEEREFAARAAAFHPVHGPPPIVMENKEFSSNEQQPLLHPIV